MNHPTEEELILHYYAENDDLFPVEQHLGACESCRALYSSLERTLGRVDTLPVAEPGPGFEGRVWARLQPALQVRSGFWHFAQAWRWAAAGAAFASLLVVAFLAGRFSPRTTPPVRLAEHSQVPQGVLLVAIGDHLERSQNILTELANASAAGPLDISFEQERAGDLLSENRLYRQSASGAGEAMLAGVLDELERILLEIEHAPSPISPAELDELRLRLRAESLLFKLRVLGSNVRDPKEPIREPL